MEQAEGYVWMVRNYRKKVVMGSSKLGSNVTVSLETEVNVSKGAERFKLSLDCDASTLDVLMESLSAMAGTSGTPFKRRGVARGLLALIQEAAPDKEQA
jgi:hypothetical protein